MLGGVPAVAQAEVAPPVAWSQTTALRPELDTTAYSIRFGGVDRYQTNLTTNLALRGTGGYPFSTPDPSSGWWGASVCPRSIIIVAGDTFADALTAASFSDPADRSSQPRLRVAASSDPVFLPVGALDRPDTAYAPIVITQSAREGATGLSATARSSAIDFNHGGCTTAQQAIIVGGTSSVPTAVARELVDLGYDEVFRVGGVDRYDTAAQIATALGVGSGTTKTACTDPDATDGSASMGWYGNAVAEFRSDATSCQLLPRAVVLTDGGQGADALAAGWWTSFWQVPMLLTAPDGSLPAATRDALQALHADSIIVLGGIGRIPESTVDEAKALAGGAAAGRIFGADRYATSVAMAEELGGWWPTGDGSDFAGSMVCLAASSGDAGWPDALAAGPWCAAAGGAAAGRGAPGRLLPPVDVSGATQVSAHVPPAHDAVPVLLVPRAASSRPAVGSLLAAAFPSSEPWCTSVAVGVCTTPGFAVVFGGPNSVSTASFVATANDVSGDRYRTSLGDSVPRLGSPFITSLDMGPAFREEGGTAGPEACVPRGALSGLRWIVIEGADKALSTIDLAGHPPFGADADGIIRSPRSVPTCWSLPADLDVSQIVGFRGVSPSGHATSLPSEGSLRVSLAAPVEVDGAAASTGLPSSQDPVSGGSTTWTFDAPPDQASTVTVKGEVADITRLTVTVVLERGTSESAPDVVSGALTLTTDRGTLTGSFDGEGLLAGGTWQLRGSVAWSGGTWTVRSGRGGFTANIHVADAGTDGGDVLSWNMDGVVR
jgi:putative cell wall-binding protein